MVDNSRLLDDFVLQSFHDFIGLYISSPPSLDEIRFFVKTRSEEKGIVNSYNDDLITQEEFCSFWISNLYTKYVLGNTSINQVENEDVEKLQTRITDLIFK